MVGAIGYSWAENMAPSFGLNLLALFLFPLVVMFGPLLEFLYTGNPVAMFVIYGGWVLGLGLVGLGAWIGSVAS